MLSENEKLTPRDDVGEAACYTKDRWPLLKEPVTVRVRMCKRGDAQYISHLDLQRTILRVLTRAGIPMWYTQGFNPHPKVIFALPLSVGTESVCEFIDLRIERGIPYDALCRQLNAQLTDDMRVFEAYEPKTKFTDMGWADYTLSLAWGDLSDEQIAAATRVLTTSPCLVTKQGKAGEKELDMVPMIRDLKIVRTGDFPGVRLTARLAASTTEYLNPEFLATVIRRELGLGEEDPTREWHRILRTEVYCADGVTVFR